MTLPDVLYKYASADTAKIVLENGKLRWASPLTFNDEAEFKRMPRFEPTIDDAHRILAETLVAVALDGKNIEESRLTPHMGFLVNFVRELAERGAPRNALLEALSVQTVNADSQVRQGLRAFYDRKSLERVRVLCLTESPVNKVMWGTYASSHHGCVLGFRHIEELSTPFLAAKKVAYTEMPPVVGSGLDFLLYGGTADLNRGTIDAICFSKDLEWSYEKEWRVMTSRDNGDQLFSDMKFYPQELESVTFGTRTSDDDRSKISELLSQSYRDVNIYRMEAVHGELKRVPL